MCGLDRKQVISAQLNNGDIDDATDIPTIKSWKSLTIDTIYLSMYIKMNPYLTGWTNFSNFFRIV